VKIFLVQYNRRRRKFAHFGIKSLFYLKTAQKEMQAVVLLIGKKYLKLFNILNLKINNKDMKGKVFVFIYII